jgi:Flp pilus assembly protein TadG
MFLCIAGIVDLGGAYQHYIVAINASREGVRLYARVPCTIANKADLRSAVIKAAVEEGETGRISVLSSNVTLTPNPLTACPTSGATVKVTVRVDYTPFLGSFWGATTFPIRASTNMMFY